MRSLLKVITVVEQLSFQNFLIGQANRKLLSVGAAPFPHLLLPQVADCESWGNGSQ